MGKKIQNKKESGMLEQFLKEVVVIVVGKSAEEIAGLLNSKKHINEFVIAKKLDITINQTRNILYKLSDCGLVNSIRKKDKKKGWYTYFWQINILKSLEFLKRYQQKRINQIYNQIKSRETKEFYICKRCNIEFTEEHALLRDFTCGECGDVFSRKDNSKLLKGLKKNADKMEKEIFMINEEINKERERLDKIREKDEIKLKKERLKKRRETKKKKEKDLKKKSKSKKKKAVKKSSKKKAKKQTKKKVKKKKSVKKKVVKKTKPKKKVIKKKKKK